MTLMRHRSEEAAVAWRDRLRHAQTRTRVLAVLGAVVVLAGAVGATVLWRISANYAALRDVGWYGPQPDRPMHVQWTDAGYGQQLLGPAGTKQEFEFGLINDGSHPITITSIDTYRWVGPGPDPVSGIVWAPYRGIQGGLVNGRPSASRPFPVHVSPHEIVKIRFTVTKPVCPASNGTELSVGVIMRVHWNAMINSHTSVIDPGLGDYRVVLCTA